MEPGNLDDIQDMRVECTTCLQQGCSIGCKCALHTQVQLAFVRTQAAGVNRVHLTHVKHEPIAWQACFQ